MATNSKFHNGYEILGSRKFPFFAASRTYEGFDAAKVRQIIHLREGNWDQTKRGRMIRKSGGIKCPGTDIALPRLPLATIPGVCSGIRFRIL